MLISILANHETVDKILSRLRGVRRCGNGYIALCPAHDDKHPSLSIREAEDGRVLLHCWTGCRTEDVVHALGLAMADLFPPRPGTTRRRTKAERREAARRQVEAALEKRFKQAENEVARDLAAMICAVNHALARGGWEAIMTDAPGADALTALAHKLDYWEYLADELMHDDETKLAILPVAAKEVAEWATLARKYCNS